MKNAIEELFVEMKVLKATYKNFSLRVHISEKNYIKVNPTRNEMIVKHFCKRKKDF